MADFEIRPVWRLHDADVERQAIAFWNQYQLMPAGVDPHLRVRELAAVAYDGDELVGVATVEIRMLQPLRRKFAAFRCAVAPDHRGEQIAVHLTRYCKPLMEKWSAEHPEEEVMGFATVLEAYKAARTREPYWPATGLTLIRYTPEGYQLRIVWFEHARV
jgi:hypothetical protein